MTESILCMWQDSLNFDLSNGSHSRDSRQMVYNVECFFYRNILLWNIKSFRVNSCSYSVSLCARACVCAGWMQAATDWSRWTTWWSWDASPTPCVSSPTSSLFTTTCASSSDPRPFCLDTPSPLLSLSLSLPLLLSSSNQKQKSWGLRLENGALWKDCYSPWWLFGEQSSRKQ